MNSHQRRKRRRRIERAMRCAHTRCMRCGSHSPYCEGRELGDWVWLGDRWAHRCEDADPNFGYPLEGPKIKTPLRATDFLAALPLKHEDEDEE